MCPRELFAANNNSDRDKEMFLLLHIIIILIIKSHYLALSYFRQLICKISTYICKLRVIKRTK